MSGTKQKLMASSLALGLILALRILGASPPLPSSLYGAAFVEGGSLPPGTRVSAWVNGTRFAEGTVTPTGGLTAYRLDVPADDPETPEIEGGKDGDLIVFKIGGVPTPETAVFESGTHERLDLTTAFGADLTLTNDDAQTDTDPGSTLTYTLRVRNQGPGDVTGVTLTDTLAPHTTFATASDDATESAGTVTWPPFDLAAGTSATRTVTVQLDDPFPVTVAELTNTATVTRAVGLDPTPENDTAIDVTAVAHPTPEITIDDVAVIEGNFATTDATFTVSLSNATATTVTVAYATADGTADGSDYAGASGTLSFAPGTTRRTLTVRVRGDTIKEDDGETFYLDLRDPVDATLADAQGLATITDDDVVFVSISEATGYEIDGRTTRAVFAVTLSGRSSRTVTVDYQTADGTATAGKDYQAVEPDAGAVSLPPGSRRGQISVPVFDDGLIERSETFFVELQTTTSGVRLGADRGRATILDNDQGRYPVVGTDVLYTDDVDFLQGRFQGLDASGLAHLQLAPAGCGFRNLWVAASRRGTILKIDTRTGTILGEYSTSPDAVADPNPSRTTVALDGSVWAGNRGAGSVVHLGLVEESQCVDRNGNGVIETSAGEGDVLAWGGEPEDECVLHYARVTAGGTRHLSVDRDNNVWVSGLWSGAGRVFDLVDGASGEILRTEGPLPCGGYGGLVDKNGVLWSANIHRGVLRWDPSVTPPTPESLRCFKIPNYGLAIDGDGDVWVARHGQVRKIRGDGGKIWGPFPHGNVAAQGLAVDARGDVWVSSAKWGGSRSVGHLKNDGTFVGTVTGVGAGSSGVAVDPEGKIWTANAASSSVTRIDPGGGPLGADGETRVGRVDLPPLTIAGASPYNYSDMIGCQAKARTAPGGAWRVIQDAGEAGARWGTITWNTEPEGHLPPGGRIAVEARAAESAAGLGGEAYVPVASGEPFERVGRFVQVRVDLGPGDDGSTPVLSDLRVSVLPPPDAPPPPALTAGNVEVFESDAGTVDAAFPVTLSAASAGTVTVAYETVEAAATPGTDYTAVSGSLSFAPGEAAKSVVVKVRGDTVAEDEEFFFLRLEEARGAVLADALGVATVFDDDRGLEPVSGEDVVHTTDADFDRGRIFNTHHDPPVGDQLQLTERIGTFPYIWIAASRRGTLVKIDTRTGAVLGEYATKPGSRNASNPNPSRTTVGLDGSVWAGNRGNGRVIHVGLVEEGHCVDRNGNGLIETSGGYGDVLPWPSGGAANARDECILHYVKVPSSIPRHVSVDGDGNVWVSGHGGSNPRVFVLIDGQTGQILRKVGPFPCGGYGGAVDRDGVLWSVRHQGLILRWDPSLPASTRRCLGSGKIDLPYGFGMGTDGDVYISRSSGRRIWKIDHETLGIRTLSHTGPSCAQGLAVDENENVWISSSRYCGTADRVTHLDSEGKEVGVIRPVPKGTTGVAVDAAGKIWFAADQSNRVFRIDPEAGPVGKDGETRLGARDLTVSVPGANPYNYSDMTGSIALRNTSPRGTWTVIQDCGRPGIPTARASWNREPEGAEPDGTEIAVAARSADTVAGLGGRSFAPVHAGETFALAGRFVELRATLRPDLEGASPVLSDLRVECVDVPRPALAIDDVTVVEGDVGSVFAFFDVTLSEPAEEEVRVHYELADASATGGEAGTAGADYVSASGTVVLPPGVLSRPLAVEVLADLVDEDDETFVVDLAFPENATLADGQGLGTIFDDDASVELTVAGVTVKEGDQGTVGAVFELTLSEPSQRRIRLDYATADTGGEEGATAGADYHAVEGYLELAPGEDAPAIVVPVVGDRDPEPDESFLLVLSNAAGVELAGETAVGTILDDDGDTTPPEVEVTGVEDDACVAGDVAPLVEVSDPNLDTVAITLDGAPFTSGTVVGEEGEHVLVVDAADTAGNRTVVTLRFTIDKTPPAIRIRGIGDGAHRADDVVPLVEVADVHLGEVTATLNGQPFASGTVLAAEGFYTLEVRAADTCGNSAVKAVSFTIDRTPPAVEILDVDDGGCVNVDVVPAVDARDDHLAGVEATLDGAPHELGTPVGAEGDHTFVATATDLAGNRTVVTVSFTIDRTPPAIAVTGIPDEDPIRHVVTPVFTATDAHLGEVTATLNGEPFASGGDVAVIGDYSLVVSASDLCGNSAAATVTFSIGACELYPIALLDDSVDGLEPGVLVDDVWNGARPGNFGWLTWAGATDMPALATSLRPPGDSHTYVNPDDADDHVVSIGDWIEGAPGVMNSAAVRSALDELKETDVVVPVWDEARGRGARTDYHTFGFARVRITDYRLPEPNQISAVFLGYERCADRGAPAPPPSPSTAAVAAPSSAESFAAATEEAHGRADWLSHGALQVDFSVERGEDAFAGSLLLEIPGARGSLYLVGTSVTFDGSDVQVSPEDSDFELGPFDIPTWVHVLTVPMKLSDPGARLRFLGEQPFAGERLPAAELTFDPGAGDRFVLYGDPASRLLRAMVWVDSTGESTRGESRVVICESFRETDGVTLATSWELRQWNAEKQSPGELLAKVELSGIRFVEPAENSVVPPRPN